LADDGGLLYFELMPGPLAGDSLGVDPAGIGIARFAPIARVTPLVASWQGQLPYVVVATDRLGAELVAVLPHRPDQEVVVEGDDLNITKSAPGGWSQRRYQQRAENRWESNVGQVADALTTMVDRHAPRLVVVSGDVRAVKLLRDQVPDRVSRLLVEVGGEYDSVDQALPRAQGLVSELAAQDGARLLEALAENHGRRDHAVLGVAEVLTKLAQSLVDVVLIDAPSLAGRTAWFGQGLTQVAEDPAVLRAYDLTAVREGDLTDVVIRAALGGGARVRVYRTRPEELGGVGLGALLRS
jgi:hypothetical protein